MPKLYSARTIIKTLQRDGFVIKSQKGSHVKLTKQLKDKKLTVIVPFHKEIAIGTFSSILRQAEKTKKEFEELVK